MSTMFLGNEFSFRAILVKDESFLLYRFHTDDFMEFTFDNVCNGLFIDETITRVSIENQIRFFRELRNKYSRVRFCNFHDINDMVLFIYCEIGNSDLIMESESIIRKDSNKLATEERIKLEIYRVMRASIASRENLLNNNL